MDKVDGTQPGDPYKAAQKILEVVESGDIPFRLILGKDAVMVAEGSLKKRKEELDRWRGLSCQTDFTLE